jgi:hypothetical protein
MHENDKYFKILQAALQKYDVMSSLGNEKLKFQANGSEVVFFIAGEGFDFEKHLHEMVIPFDYIVRQSSKVAAMVRSKLKLNKTIFARNCEVKKINKSLAAVFFDTYHLMNSTSSAYNFGLYDKNELVAAASFSKGRKMNRLKPDQRSYELIRFCSRDGITVTGGLTRLIKSFCTEKKPGDLMTYVDKQLSDGKSFINAGFKKYGETSPVFFLVDKETFERKPVEKDLHPIAIGFDNKRWYLTQNGGNIKLIYTPGE